MAKRNRFQANQVIVDGSNAFVILYDKLQNETARAIIDAEDIDKLAGFKWGLSDKYHVRGSRMNNGKREQIKLHRLITNVPKGLCVDHINGNPLDNRKSNLRICTQTQNSYNSARQKNNKSGCLGVFQRGNRWEARIMVNRKVIYLGLFPTKEEAISARLSAEVEFYGEFVPEFNKKYRSV